MTPLSHFYVNGHLNLPDSFNYCQEQPGEQGDQATMEIPKPYMNSLG